MLKINNLHASVNLNNANQAKKILKGLNLNIKPGEVHAIMGPNGSGKTTLANVLSGRPGFDITEGAVEFNGQDLLKLSPAERAWAGVFLAFQYPVEIPGVNNLYFLKAALNAKRKSQNLDPMDAIDFMAWAKSKMAVLSMDKSFLERSVNTGFSGGEKKRNEIFQMLVLEPSLIILDETDSGLDIDALQIVSKGVNELRSPDRSFIVITHYQRLLDYIKPDFVHVLSNGQIIKSGDKNLALELEEKGYGWLLDNKLGEK